MRQLILGLLLLATPAGAVGDPDIDVWHCIRKIDNPPVLCDRFTDPAQLSTRKSTVAIDIWAQPQTFQIADETCQIGGKLWIDPDYYGLVSCDAFGASDMSCQASAPGELAPPNDWPNQSVRISWTLFDSTIAGPTAGDLFHATGFVPVHLGTVVLSRDDVRSAPVDSRTLVAHQDPPGDFATNALVRTAQVLVEGQPAQCNPHSVDVVLNNARTDTPACGIGYELALLALAIRRVRR